MAAHGRRGRVQRSVAPEALVLGLCHEIGNILAGARLAAHLVARGLAEGDVADAARRIEAETARAGAYLGQIRPLLRVGVSRRPRVTASEVLAGLERSLGAAAGGPRQLVIQAPQRVPDLAVDPDALHHVLVALVLSAADVTPSERTVRVSARRREASVVFRIEDDGGPLEVGPPPGEAPRRGRPLVLAAASRIVRGQGGRMTTAPCGTRRGTRVEIVLPALRSTSTSARRRR